MIERGGEPASPMEPFEVPEEWRIPRYATNYNLMTFGRVPRELFLDFAVTSPGQPKPMLVARLVLPWEAVLELMLSLQDAIRRTKGQGESPDQEGPGSR